MSRLKETNFGVRRIEHNNEENWKLIMKVNFSFKKTSKPKNFTIIITLEP